MLYSGSLATRRVPTRHPQNNSIERQVSCSAADVPTLSKNVALKHHQLCCCVAVLQTEIPRTDNSTDSRTDEVVYT